MLSRTSQVCRTLASKATALPSFMPRLEKDHRFCRQLVAAARATAVDAMSEDEHFLNKAELASEAI